MPAPLPLEHATERGVGTVVLLAGSVGTGKTTLLAGWARDLAVRGDCVGWLAVDREDNDPLVLAGDLLGALRSALAGLEPDDDAADGGVLAAGIGGPVAGRALVEHLSTRAARAGRDVWLFLDDVHLVRDPRGLALLDLLVRHAPSGLHVVVATRADPGLHLARLRLDERLVEVRERQLRFGLDETRELLVLHGLDLEQRHVQRLQELTEGWAAGITMAAVSLARGRDPERFLHEFARSDHAMSGYLVEEVLAGLEASTRDFLVATSVLDEVTADLAAAVTGRDDAGLLLASLASDNAMVGSDPDVPPTYRYHVLLRSYLGAMLEASSLERSRDVHGRAARWYAAHDMPGRALAHAEAAGDLGTVEDVLQHHALHLLLDDRAADLDAAVRAVADHDADPTLTAVAALTSLALSDPAAAAAQLVSLTSGPTAPGSAAGAATPAGPGIPVDRLLAVGLRWLGFVGGLPRPSSGKTPPGVGWVNPLRDGIAEELSATISTWSAEPLAAAPAARGPAGHAQHDLVLLEQLTSGDALLGAARFEEARTAYGSALTTARASGHALPALQAMVGLASTAAGQQDLEGMRAWSDRALAAAAGTPWAGSPRLLPAHVLGAWGAYHLLDAPSARARNAVALELLATLARGPVVPEALPADAVAGRADHVLGDPADLGPAAFGGTGPDSPARRGIEQLARLVRLLEAHLDLESVGDEPGGRHEVAARVAASAQQVVGASMTDAMAMAELFAAHRLVLVAGFPRLANELEVLCAGTPVAPEQLAAMASVRELRCGDDAAARASVARVWGRGATPPTLHVAVTAHVVAAVLAHRNAQPTVAQEELVAALRLAAPQRAPRMVLDVSPEVVDVLAVGAGRFGSLEPFAGTLLEQARAGAIDLREARGDVTLSARELTLLRELPSLLTIAEIAAARAVSPNTVKTQLRSLFQKLGVGSRRDAVAAARRLGLL
ncbi:LuxR C-terminal-related transcriptional regulator [Terrabacter sp. NPDC000476]|uniref:AAA family ATPase n=1 Tax=Terrabacter sp. NPDC000476 TaxID=3154258 RepID=UPI0033178287